MATTREVTIEEHRSFVDIQQPDGSVKRYFPINRVVDVIGLVECLATLFNVAVDLSNTPYIWGSDSSGRSKLFKLEVQNGELWLSDEVDNPEFTYPISVDNLYKKFDKYLS